MWLVALAGLATVPYVLRNTETRTLDDAARLGAPGDFVRLPDGMVHFEFAGPDSGATVVLVHGLSVPFYIWDSTAARLRDAGFRVLRYDLYGRGYSDRPRTPYDTALLVRQLDGLLDSLHVEGPVDLVGLSMGGRVVTAYALGHRSRVRTVTMVDPAFSRPQPLPWSLRVPGLATYVFTVARVRRLAESQLTDFLHPERYPDWPDRYRVQMQYRGFRRAILSTLRASAVHNDATLYERFGAMGLPSLLVWGKYDQTVPFLFADSVRARVPGIRFVPVDSAGHLPHMEQPELTHQALIEFLRHPEPPAEAVVEPPPPHI